MVGMDGGGEEAWYAITCATEPEVTELVSDKGEWVWSRTRVRWVFADCQGGRVM